MECLTAKECRRLVESRGMAYCPRPARVSPAAQLSLPPSAPERSALAGSLAPLFGDEARLLLVADDWAHYSPEEMAQVDAIRAESGETRPLIDAPGHRFQKAEILVASHLAALMLGFPSRWSFYLYGMSSRSTLLFWEGDLLDVWGSNGLVTELRSFLP